MTESKDKEMTASAGADRPWLVKSSGRVLGPFSSSDIERLLRSKELVPLDEISKSFGRWHYIRDNRGFDVIINQIRNRQDASSEGATTDGNEGTQTETDLLGATVTHFKKHETLVQGVRDQVTQALEGQRAGPFKPVASDPEPPSVFVSPAPAEAKARPHVGLLWLVALAISTFVVWGIYKGKPQSRMIQDVGFDALIRNAHELMQVGENKRARTKIEEALRLRPQDEPARVDLSRLLIWDNEVGEAKRALNELLREVENVERRSIYLNLLGLSEMTLGNLVEAEAHFRKSLEAVPTAWSPLLNLSFVLMRTGDAKNVVENIEEQVFGHQGKDPVGLMLLGEAYLKVGSGIEKTKLEGLISRLDEYHRIYFEFAQETRILSLLLQSKVGKVENADSAMGRILDWDPDISRFHPRDLNLHDGFADWSVVRRWVQELRKGVAKLPGGEVLEALAIYRSESKLEGRRRLEQVPNNSQYKWAAESLLSYYYLTLGSHRDAEVLLKNIVDSKRHSLPLVLMGRLCFREDRLSCARDSWKSALDLDPSSLMALTGLALLSKRQGVGGDALERATALSANFAPLNKLKFGREFGREFGGEEF